MSEFVTLRSLQDIGTGQPMNLNSKYFDMIRTARREQRALPGESRQMCDWPECRDTGEYPAPAGPRSSEKRHFCYAHVAQFNRSYNYFEGMSDDDAERFRRAAQTGHRPTWAMGARRARGSRAEDWQFHDPLELMQHAGAVAGEATGPSRVTAGQKRALTVLDLPETAKPEDVRKRYKLLVKQYHPDANGGDRRHEDDLQSVIQAHDYLKASGFC